MTSDYASHPQHFNHMVEAFRRDLKQYHSQLNNITDAPWFCGDTTWYWKENFPHSYEAIYGNYQNNVLANIIFVDFQQQGERGLTNAPDEDPDDLARDITVQRTGHRRTGRRHCEAVISARQPVGGLFLTGL